MYLFKFCLARSKQLYGAAPWGTIVQGNPACRSRSCHIAVLEEGNIQAVIAQQSWHLGLLHAWETFSRSTLYKEYELLLDLVVSQLCKQFLLLPPSASEMEVT